MALQTRLSYIFGTEEIVRMRRELVLLREKLFYLRYGQIGDITFCTGSQGEGAGDPPSDDDYMTYHPDECRVVELNSPAPQFGDILMVPSEFTPGYCLLALLPVFGFRPREEVVHVIDGMPIISSMLFKNIANDGKHLIHGPCVHNVLVGSATENYEFDSTLGLPSPFWPSVATEWITRDRTNGWPSPEMIRSLIDCGFHVVPVGDRYSPNGCHEWRISFTVAERTLMHSLTHCQFLIYNMLRMLLKKVIEVAVPDALCSYFMKTILFYSYEKIPSHLWQEEDIDTCFRTCLSVLYEFVDQRYLPNYFIRDNNMIKRKVNDTNRLQLLNIIKHVQTIGIVGAVHLCGQSICLDERLTTVSIECRHDFVFMNAPHAALTIRMLIDLLSDLCREDFKPFTYFVQNVVPLVLGLSTEKLILKSGILHCAQLMMNNRHAFLGQNKNTYNHHKTIGALLRMGYARDFTTGKLTAATYMYLVGKTNSASSLIHLLIYKYPSYAIDSTSNEVQRKRSYIDNMCRRGHTFEYRMRHAYAPLYRLNASILNAFPLPLRIWIACQENFASVPTVYAYLVASLCYIQSHDRTRLRHATTWLIRQMDDMERDLAILHSRLFLGITKYVQGDNQSACRWFSSAYILKDAFFSPYKEKFQRAVQTYIACMLNKQFSSQRQ